MSSSIQILCLHPQIPKYPISNPSLRLSQKPPSLTLPLNKRLKISSKLPRNPFQRKSGLLQRVAVSVIGGCILLGSFGWSAQPILALPAESSSSSEDEEIYEKLLEQGPKDVQALKVLIYGKIRKGKSKQALTYVRKLINMEPEEIEWRFMEALCYEMMGQLNKAKGLYKDILKDNPLLLRALHGLALAMHESNEDSAMFEMLNKALEIAISEKKVTEERNIKILIAQMHVAKGELEEGLKKYQLLIEENPGDFRPYLCQGIIYSLLDKKKEAEEQFETYQSLVPEEFPGREFLNDVVLEAKTVSQLQQLHNQFEPQFHHGKSN